MTQKINPPAIERITRVDVASVAGTVDLTASVPFVDDIRITGALAITKFTGAVGRVLRVTAGGAFTLTNNANIVTQTGANIVAASGDTFMLRATAADTVEVLEYVPAAVASATARGMVTLASNAEAQAGTDAVKPITPSTMKAGLNASGSAPTFAVRAWCIFDGTVAGTNAPTAGGNVTSVTRNSVGNYTINFTTALPSANFSGTATGQRSGTSIDCIVSDVSRTTNSWTVLTTNAAAGTEDFKVVQVHIVE